MERWNKSFGSVFDVPMEAEQPVGAEVTDRITAKFLECQIKDLFKNGTTVPSPRMGSFLTGLKHVLRNYKLLEVRNFEGGGYDKGVESPPVHEAIQLNSKLSDAFLVQGMAFFEGIPPMKAAIPRIQIGKSHKGQGAHNATRGAGEKFVVKFSPTWNGLRVTVLTKNCCAPLNARILADAWEWAKQNNFLKGEAFALSGEFLTRTPEDWGDVILEEKNKKTVQRTIDLFNTKQLNFANRGVILTGPPGTGKTLSGRIIRNQAKGTFIWISSRDFHASGSVGGISIAFDMAKELAPSVIFMEDVDNWLGPTTVDLLKTEMDGIGRSKGVLTILTTNFPEQLPDALIDRPGRFHDVLSFDLPTPSARKAMLEKWLPSVLASHIEGAVTKTAGYSGAHVYELAEFAKTLHEHDGVAADLALNQALTKVQEQRDLITHLQLEGSNYNPLRRQNSRGETISMIGKATKKSCCTDCHDGKACGCSKKAVERLQKNIGGGTQADIESPAEGPSQLQGPTKAQPSSDIDPDKACQILHDGTVNGKPITDDQRRMFGAACSRAQKSYGGLRETCRAMVQKQQDSDRARDPKTGEPGKGGTGAGTEGKGPGVAETGKAKDKPQVGTPDIQAPGWLSCVGCQGSGNCPQCEGTGEVQNGKDTGECKRCGGSGDCIICGGKGLTEKDKDDSVRIDVTDASNALGDIPAQANKQRTQKMITTKGRKAMDEGTMGDVDAQTEPVVQGSGKPQTKASVDEPFNPKPSAQVLAALYSHAKAEAQYLEGELQKMDNDGVRTDLMDYQDNFPGGPLKRMEHYSSILSKYHTDHDMEKMVKAMETDTAGPTAGGEAQLVDQGQVPPEAAAPDAEMPMPEGGEAPFEGLETPGEEAAEQAAGGMPTDADMPSPAGGMPDTAQPVMPPSQKPMPGKSSVDEPFTPTPTSATDTRGKASVDEPFDPKTGTASSTKQDSSDPDTEEILERYRHPKSGKMMVRKVGTIRRAGDGNLYLTVEKKDRTPMDNRGARQANSGLGGDSFSGSKLTDRGHAEHNSGTSGDKMDSETTSEGVEDQANTGANSPHGEYIIGSGKVDWGKKAAKYQNTVTKAAKHLYSLSKAQDIPELHKAGLEYHAKELGGMGKDIEQALTLSQATNKPAANGQTKSNGQPQNGADAPVGSLVEQKFKALQRKFKLITGKELQ